MKFDIDIPPVIRFGRKCRFALPSLLPEGPLLFICGKHAVPRIEKEMLPLLSGREVYIRCGFKGEPHLDEVEELLAFARSKQIKAVAGWGGGSAMDGAKAVAALLPETAPVADFFYNRAAAQDRRIYLILLPTTAGTGAEITANAVLTDAGSGIKQSLRTAGMAADAALVDPELVQECPSSVMAASGFDALTQAMESFISLKANALTRSLSRSAVRDIFLNLSRACAHDEKAVDAVTLGCLNAAVAFSRSGLGAVHGVGHPVGSLLSVPHGIACAVLLTEVLRFNAPVCGEALDELAVTAGLADAEELIANTELLRKELQIPADFKPYGLNKTHYPFIIQNCRSGSMKCNPRNMSDAQVAELLEKLT
ncbi:MAG: iron-containing alcohol dehydrogenase [Lentisphaeria bacterium]|nr:iron-containing alcohol dehydrogenase [Lentisphaeria bacterium]